MIDRGYYLIERRHGIRASWVVGYNRSVDSDTGKVTENRDTHPIVRGVLFDQKISNFDRVLRSLVKFGGNFDEEVVYFALRRAYAPRKYNLEKPNTNDILIINDDEYKIISIEVSDVLVLKLKRIN